MKAAVLVYCLYLALVVVEVQGQRKNSLTFTHTDPTIRSVLDSLYISKT